MKLLLDQNLSFKLCKHVDDLFPGSSQIRSVGLAQSDDRTVWQFVTLVSQDADFAEMAALLGSPPKVTWLRAGNQPTEAIAMSLRTHAELIIGFENDDTAACLEIY
jgi:predicted nuclease of predicted toxin-antitoxin system